MALLQHVVIALASICLTWAIHCYEADHGENKVVKTCPEGNHCTNLTEYNNSSTLHYYSCAEEPCTDGCNEISDMATFCCCSTDLCNEAMELTSNMPALLAISVIILSLLLCDANYF
ncbi:unnamed protein product [Cylicocyclus nassatus]|uniref:Uncharacterized protein n=1 Tax=Cylicocyclus nassatus TaxID=53992 RepID=A0AA36HC52_CYLNA|nr:unnamed protein product [Cylicocyclus nassatus]